MFFPCRYDNSGPCLLEAIDRFRIPERLVEKPFRLSISDVYKAQTGFSCSGRIEAGFVQKDDKVLILPFNQVRSSYFRHNLSLAEICMTFSISSSLPR